LVPTSANYQLWFWKYSPIFLFLIGKICGLFFTFGPFGAIFWVWVRFKNFFRTINFGFGSTALTFGFKFGHILGLFCTFLGPLGQYFGPLGLFLESGFSGSKTFLEPNSVVNQLWFWKYSPIFWLLLWPTLGPFCPFWAFGAIFVFN